MKGTEDVGALAPWLEQAWLTRYLDRELSEAEQAWFEAYALDRPGLLDAIEAENRLRDLVNGHAVIAAAPGRAAAEPPAAAGRPSTVPPQIRHGRWLPLAASFVAGLGLSWVGRGLVDPAAAPDRLLANPTRIVFDTFRHTGRSGQIEEPGNPAARLFIIEVPVPAGAEVVAARLQVDQRTHPVHPAPRVSAEGFVTLTVPAAWRHRARLHLDLRAADATPLPAVEVDL